MKMLTVGTKVDKPEAVDNLAVLRELKPDFPPVLPISVESPQGIDEIPRRCFDMLDIVRIYTKQPGRPPDMVAPFALPNGSSTLDLARAVHRDLRNALKSARVWGSAKFDGQTVQRNHILEDGDVVELHV